MDKVTKIMGGSEIRSAFIEYFKQNGHTAVSSSSLVPLDDPTLLFTNAGMNQFKDVFLGKVSRGYTRATTSQKVVRAGGKHNDLENVGRTSRHHTFFEMLGNFSFGDYFKKEAIAYAWDFLTNTLSLPKDKLFVSVYNDDDEAFNLWRDMIGLPEDRIHRRGEKDNFWQMGDTGPCGPCSEIHIDQGEGTGCGSPDCSPNCDCDRHLELWNLVFMQFNRDENGVLHPLPKPSIDTGMGLERVTSVVQKVQSNYDTDLFLPIINFIADGAKCRYKDDPSNDVSMRVIADHARSASFLIADGVMPSNEGRGNVLRRIMRRAMRHGSMLGLPSVFFHKVCAFVIDFMKGHYIELSDKKVFVETVVKAEEEAFSRTLNIGLKIIQEEILDRVEKDSVVSGEIVFKLYDTHGFPVDLLEDILTDAGLTLDKDEFNKFMKKQQELAKKAGLGGAGKALSDILVSVGDKYKSDFVGYDNFTATSKVLSIILDGKEVNDANEGSLVEIVTAITPFYPEGGGQTGDTGTIATDKSVINIDNTYRAGSAIIHKGTVFAGKLSVGDEVVLGIDIDKRFSIEKSHTASHLLHKALHTVLGEHARQAGSSVTSDGLRFDFTHFGQVTSEELERITDMVNEAVAKGYRVTPNIMNHTEAVKKGAMALFGEKYGDEVRVIEVEQIANIAFSRELCGGCHVDNTAKIGAFVITSESSIAAGVRRIEALTGLNAMKYLLGRSKMLVETSRLLKSSADEVLVRVSDLQNSLKDKDKMLKEFNERDALEKALESFKAVRNINGVKVLTFKLDNISAEDLRKAVDSVINQMKNGGVVLAASVSDGKVNFACRVTSDLVGKYKAGALIREVAKVAGGSGGGRDDMAQAGAKDVSKVDEALELLYTLI